MRLLECCALLVLGALAAAVPPVPARGGSPEAVAGDWQTVIASPKRPWIFVVHLRPVGSEWRGTMSFEGMPDMPLRDVRVESTWVHFQLPPELDSTVFEGTLGSAGIVGQVPELGQMIPTRLTRVVPLPAPANRVEAWQQDLDFASARLPEYDRSFTSPAREEFQQALAQVRLGLPHENDAEILVALSRAVALSGNAHTRLRLDPTRQGAFSTEFPIRIWWFSDGPFVVRAAPQYKRALRCRVVAIDGHNVSAARDQVARLFAGNASWAAYLSPIYLTSPDILYGLGLIRSVKAAAFTFENDQGCRFDLRIDSERIRQSNKPADSWQELSPLLSTGKPRWTTAVAARPDGLPLYLRHPDQAYWFEFRPESGLLYFQFNIADNAKEGPPFQEFGDSLLAFVEGHSVDDVVVDLRFNSGGNLDVARSFIRGLASNEKINRRGHCFVITGHCTFSAGLYHAAQLRQFTQATFVGEAVGDQLDFWAEGGHIVLPNSHAVIAYANGFHRYSGVDYPEYRPYYEELSVASLAPDVPAPTSSGDYFSGRDPALAVIETRLRK